MELLDPRPLFNPYIENFWSCPASARYGRFLNIDRLEKLLREHALGNPLTRRSVTSSGVQIEEGAVVEDCILLPGARIRKGARLRRIIVDEDVEIPEGCEIGWDLDHDRKLYTVSSNGVVVVSRTSRPIKPSRVVTFVPSQNLEIQDSSHP
jgi:glucose-1-phosphate adenylyltransferase